MKVSKQKRHKKMLVLATVDLSCTAQTLADIVEKLRDRVTLAEVAVDIHNDEGFDVLRFSIFVPESAEKS